MIIFPGAETVIIAARQCRSMWPMPLAAWLPPIGGQTPPSHPTSLPNSSPVGRPNVHPSTNAHLGFIGCALHLTPTLGTHPAGFYWLPASVQRCCLLISGTAPLPPVMMNSLPSRRRRTRKTTKAHHLRQSSMCNSMALPNQTHTLCTSQQGCPYHSLAICSHPDHICATLSSLYQNSQGRPRQ